MGNQKSKGSKSQKILNEVCCKKAILWLPMLRSDVDVETMDSKEQQILELKCFIRSISFLHAIIILVSNTIHVFFPQRIGSDVREEVETSACDLVAGKFGLVVTCFYVDFCRIIYLTGFFTLPIFNLKIIHIMRMMAIHAHLTCL